MRFLNGTGILNSSYQETAGKPSFKNKNMEIISHCFSYMFGGEKKKCPKIKKNTIKKFLATFNSEVSSLTSHWWRLVFIPASLFLSALKVTVAAGATATGPSLRRHRRDFIVPFVIFLFYYFIFLQLISQIAVKLK